MNSKIHSAADGVQKISPGAYKLSAALVGLDLARLKEWRGIVIDSAVPRPIKRQYVSAIDGKIQHQLRLANK